MTVTANTRVAAVRFHKIGKLYHFDASEYPELAPADYVVVETSRGRQLGQVIAFVAPADSDAPDIKPIKAPATARDMMMKKLWEAKGVEALIDCREVAAKLGGFKDVKFIKASYNYDGSMLTILYTSEDNVDTSALRKKLAQQHTTRVDVRRIGARDAAKMLGEYGACGAPRCCSTFLTDFSPVSIKMAKAQGISLNPSEITGMCGRLRCCLVYEYEQYVEANKHLPRNNKWIGTAFGEGKVIDRNPLKETVTVLVNDQRHEVHKDELVHVEEMRALEEKARAGCSKEGQGGPCECGARIRDGKPAEASAADKNQPDDDSPGGDKKSSSSRRRRGRRGGRRNRRKQNNN